GRADQPVLALEESHDGRERLSVHRRVQGHAVGQDVTDVWIRDEDLAQRAQARVRAEQTAPVTVRAKDDTDHPGDQGGLAPGRWLARRGRSETHDTLRPRRPSASR